MRKGLNSNSISQRHGAHGVHKERMIIFMLSLNTVSFVPRTEGSMRLRVKKFTIILFVLFFLGCNRENTQAAVTEQAEEVEYIAVAFEEIDEEAPPAVHFVLSAPNARPGEHVTVGLRTLYDGRSFQALLFDSRDRRIARATFFVLEVQEMNQILMAAVMAIPSTALVEEAIIRIESEGEILGELPFTIDNREFHSETIELGPSNTALRTTPDPRRTAESEQIWAIFNRTGREIHTLGPFIRPVTSTRRTSIYGSRRVFHYSDGSVSSPAVHAGVDYGVPTGTEVMASGAGRVVLARERIITGNSVILEHLPGVYSVYYHLDSINVSEGEIVEAGEILGLSGATGLATGPHLHWEIRVSGENADPDAFLSQPIIDKNELIYKLGTRD